MRLEEGRVLSESQSPIGTQKTSIQYLRYSFLQPVSIPYRYKQNLDYTVVDHYELITSQSPIGTNKAGIHFKCVQFRNDASIPYGYTKNPLTYQQLIV